MTPEACYSALQLLDRWALTLRSLAGEPLPKPPAHPAEHTLMHRLPPVPDGDADEFADAWDARRTLADDCEGATHE